MKQEEDEEEEQLAWSSEGKGPLIVCFCLRLSLYGQLEEFLLLILKDSPQTEGQQEDKFSNQSLPYYCLQ